MLLKILGLGPITYIKDRMNKFDAIIVAISILELQLGSGGSSLSVFRSVRIFRSLRVLRVTRVIRSLAFMNVIINVL